MFRLYTLWQLEQELSPDEFRYILTPTQALKKAIQCYDLDYRNYTVPLSGEAPRRLSGSTNKPYKRADHSVFDPVYDDLVMKLYEGWIVGVDIDEPWDASINPFYINADNKLIFDSPDRFCWEITAFSRAYQLAIKGGQADTTVSLDNILEDIRKTNLRDNISIDNISRTVAENSSFFYPVINSPQPSWFELLGSLVINNFSLNDIVCNFARFINPGVDAPDSNIRQGHQNAKDNSSLIYSLNNDLPNLLPENARFNAETVATSGAASVGVPFIIPLLSWLIPGQIHGALYSKNQDEAPDNTGGGLLSALDPETLKLRENIKFAIESKDIAGVIEGFEKAEGDIYSILRVRSVTDHHIIEMMNTLWVQIDHLLIEANQYRADMSNGDTDNNFLEWIVKWKEKFADLNVSFNYIETGTASPVGLSFFDDGNTRATFDKCKMKLFNVAREVESHSIDSQNSRQALGFKLFITKKLRGADFVVLSENEKIANMDEYLYKSVSEAPEYLKSYSKEVLDEFAASHFYRSVARKSTLQQSVGLINKNLGIVFNSDDIEEVIRGLQNAVGTVMASYLYTNERDEVLTNNLDMLWINIDKLIAEAKNYRHRLNKNDSNTLSVLQEIKEWQMLLTCNLSSGDMPVKYLTEGVPLSSWVALCLTNYRNSHFEQCKVILFRMANEVESGDLIYNAEHLAVPYKKFALAKFENIQFASLSENKKIANLLPEIHSGFKNKPEGLSSFANRVYEKMKADVDYSAIIFRSGIQSRIARVQKSIESALNNDNTEQMIEGIQDAENQMLMHFRDDELNSPLEIAWMNIDFLMTEAKRFQASIQQSGAAKESIHYEMLEWQRGWRTRLSDHNTSMQILDKDFVSITEKDSLSGKNKAQYFNEGKRLLFNLADEMEIQNAIYRNEHMALGFKIFAMNKYRESDFVVRSDTEKVKTMLSYLDIESSQNVKEFIDYSLSVTDMMLRNKGYLAIRNNSLIELYLKRLQRKLRMAFESDDFTDVVNYLKSAVDYADSGVKDLLYKTQYDGRGDNNDISKLKTAWRKIEEMLTQARQYEFSSADYLTEIKSWQMQWKNFFLDDDMSARYLTTEDGLASETTRIRDVDAEPGFADVKKLLFRIADETALQGEAYDQEILRQDFKQLAADKFNDASFAASGEYRKIRNAGTYLSQTFGFENQSILNSFAWKVINKLSNNDEYLVIKVSAMKTILKRPELNVDANIEKHIFRRIKAYEKKHGVTISDSSTKDISVILEPLRLAGMNNEGPVAPQSEIYTTTLKNILTGQYKYHVYEMRDNHKRPYSISGFGSSDKLIEELASLSLEDEIGTEIDSFFNDAATEQAMKDATLGMIRYRCMAYMDRPHREKPYYSAVRAFLEGKNQASSLAFHGIPLDGVFYIPAGKKNGIIFSIHDSSFFHSVRGEKITAGMGGQKDHFYSYPSTSEFRQWVRSHLSAYNTVLFLDENVFNIMSFMVPDAGILHISPLVFGSRVTSTSLADVFYNIQKERVKSDADVMILSNFEDVTLRSLQAFKLISGIMGVILSGTGTPVGMATSLLLEAASIAAAAGQMKLTDIPDDYNNYLNELMISILLYGAGSSENIKTLRRVYRQGKKKMAVFSGDILNPVKGKTPVTGGGKSSNEHVISINDDLVVSDSIERITTSTKNIVLSDPEVKGFIFSPEGNCAEAAIRVSRLLRDNGYTDVTRNEIGIFASAHTISNNHYVVFARKNGVDIAVDPTVKQLIKYGFSHPVVSTKNSWLAGAKTAFDKKQRLLVKVKMDVKGSLANSPFSDSRMAFANDILPDEHIGILSGSDWYKSGYNDGIPVPKLLKGKEIDNLNAQRDKYRFYVESLSKPKASHSKLQRFNDGEKRADAIYPSGAPEREMSEGELMDKFNNGEPTLEERGALSVLIESANKLRIQSHGLGLSRKYLKAFEHGSTLEIAAPQQYIISRLGGTGSGRCFPLSISAAAASSDNKIEIFLNKLMYDNVDKNVLSLLDHLHGSSDVQSALRVIQFSNNRQSGSIDDIFNYIRQIQGEHYYHLKTPSHSMLLGLAETSGVQRFSFYDPSFGYIEYKSFDAFKNALKRNLESGELAVQYKAYNSELGQAFYGVEEINISRLKELTFNADGKLQHTDALYAKS